jgi:hypothetical protein
MTACEQFVGIGLVPDVPDNLIVRRVEQVMQGNGQFRGTQIRGEMAAISGDDLDEALPNLGRDLRELIAGKFFEICGSIYVVKQGIHT